MTVMTEQIACVICDAPGVLRLDLHPQQVEHPRRGARPRYCTLPPRDIPHPQDRRRGSKNTYLPNPYRFPGWNE